MRKTSSFFSISAPAPIWRSPVLLAACCGLSAASRDQPSQMGATLTFGNTTPRNLRRGPDENNNFVEKSTKTAAGTRTIRMFPLVSDSLKRRKDSSPDTGDYIAPARTPSATGFRCLIKKHGFPHYRFHDLRHYTVSVMLSLNIP